MFKFKCIKLKELRLEFCYSIEDLASLTKISIDRLTKLENLDEAASLYEVGCLTCALDTNIDYIVGESSIKNYPIDLPFDQFDDYIKKYNTINKNKSEV